MTPLEIRQDIKRWTARNMDWVTRVSGPMLELHGNYDLGLYLDELISGGYALDELALLIISRMYEVGICVFFNKYFWTTLASDNIEDCHISVAFRGDLTFSDTTTRKAQPVMPVTKSPIPSFPSLLTDYVTPGPSETAAVQPTPTVSPPRPRRQGRQTRNSLRSGYVSSEQMKEMYRYIPRAERAAKRKAAAKVAPRKKTAALYLCPISSCHKTFKLKTAMYTHIQDLHPYFRFECEHCDGAYQSQYALDKHMRKHTGQCETCNICGRTFLHKFELEDHTKLHTGKGMHECRVCKKLVNTKRGLKQHEDTHSEQLHHCPHCTFTSNRRPYVRQHVLACHSTGTAAICGDTFKWPYQKIKHEKECEDCTFIFDSMKAEAQRLRLRLAKKTADE